MDTKEQLYLLVFRGILFAFPVWSGSELVPGLSTESPDLSELSTQRSFILSRVCIFSGNDSKEARYIIKAVCMCCLAPDICTLSCLGTYMYIRLTHSKAVCWRISLHLYCPDNNYFYIEPLRAPSLPLECYHGNCYCDSVELLRVGGVVTGLSLKLIADGRSATHSELRLW